MADFNTYFGNWIELAPDLTFPSAKATGADTYRTSAVTDYSTGGLVEAFDLTGPGVFSHLSVSGLTAEEITLKLTVDSVVIWSDTWTCGTGELLFGGDEGATIAVPEMAHFATSFKFEMTTVDSAVSVLYAWRPTVI